MVRTAFLPARGYDDGMGDGVRSGRARRVGRSAGIGGTVNIRGLGYVGFGAPDPKIWLTYATGILGLMPARAVAGESWGAPGQGPASGGSGIAPDGGRVSQDGRLAMAHRHPSQQRQCRAALYGLRIRRPDRAGGCARGTAAGGPSRRTRHRGTGAGPLGHGDRLYETILPATPSRFLRADARPQIRLAARHAIRLPAIWGWGTSI